MLGFINIFKPSSVSSAFAVSKFKKKVKCKCGHMGTLDPLASGVLPIGLNQANRLFDFLLDKKKIYNAIFDFSYQTASFDSETEIIKKADYIPSFLEVQSILPKFIGKISQIPPAYSAKMIDGKRSYKLARAGVNVELQPKEVEILDVRLNKQIDESKFSFTIECRGGTYIRSLARDFGECFSCGATMVALERTACGNFTKENSVGLNEFLDCEDVEKFIIKPEDVVEYPKLILSSLQSTRLLNGLYDEFDLPNGLFKVYSLEQFWGVGQIVDKKLKMKAYVRDLES